MESYAGRKARIARLSEEVHAIDRANNSYWEQGEAASPEARAEYHRRLDRLEEIRAEFLKLHKI